MGIQRQKTPKIQCLCTVLSMWLFGLLTLILTLMFFKRPATVITETTVESAVARTHPDDSSESHHQSPKDDNHDTWNSQRKQKEEEESMSLLKLLQRMKSMSVNNHRPCGFDPGLVFDLHHSNEREGYRSCYMQECYHWHRSFENALSVDAKMIHDIASSHHHHSYHSSHEMDSMNDPILKNCEDIWKSDTLSFADVFFLHFHSNKNNKKHNNNKKQRFLKDGTLWQWSLDYSSSLMKSNSPKMTLRRCQVLYRVIRRWFMMKSIFDSPFLLPRDDGIYSLFQKNLQKFREIEVMLNDLEKGKQLRKTLHYHIPRAGGTMICQLARESGLTTSGYRTNCNLNETYFSAITPKRTKQGISRCSLKKADWCECLRKVSDNVGGKNVEAISMGGPAPRLPDYYNHKNHEPNNHVYFPTMCIDEFWNSMIFRYPLNHALSFLDFSFRSKDRRTSFMVEMRKTGNFSGIFEWYYQDYTNSVNSDDKWIHKLTDNNNNNNDNDQIHPHSERLSFLSNIVTRWIGLPTNNPGGWDEIIGKTINVDDMRRRWDALINAVEWMMKLDFIMTIDNDRAEKDSDDDTRGMINLIDETISNLTRNMNGHDLYYSNVFMFGKMKTLMKSMIVDDQSLNYLFRNLSKGTIFQTQRGRYKERKELIKKSINRRDRRLHLKYNELDHRLFDYAWMAQMSDLLYYKVIWR